MARRRKLQLQDFADTFDVSRSTIHRWIDEFGEYDQSDARSTIRFILWVGYRKSMKPILDILEKGGEK